MAKPKTKKEQFYGGAVTTDNRAAVEASVKEAFSNPLKPGVYQSNTNNPLSTATNQSTSKGGYSAKAGGYIDATGKKYTTGNPDFVPSQTDSNINFLPNKNVVVTKGNVTQELSPQEYATLQGEAGAQTNKVVSLLPQKELFNTPDITQIQEQGNVGLDVAGMQGGRVGEVIKPVANFIESFSSFLPEFLQLGTKKSVGVIKAEGVFADNKEILDTQISLYQQGAIPRETVQASLDAATDSIIQLQKETKGLGQANLRFWLDNGREIEAQIERELTTLQNQINKLNSLP